MVTIVRDRVAGDDRARGRRSSRSRPRGRPSIGSPATDRLGTVDDRAVRRGGLSQPHRKGGKLVSRPTLVMRRALLIPRSLCVALAGLPRRPRRSSTSPAATTRSSTRISPSAFRDRRSATISVCRSTTAPARLPTPGTPRGSRCPSTSAARIPRPTSCAARSTCGSGTSATPRRSRSSPSTSTSATSSSAGRCGWTAGRIRRASPSTPGWVFRPGRGTAKRWSSRRRTSSRCGTGATACRRAIR